MKSLRRWVDLISSTIVDFICVIRFHPCIRKDFIQVVKLMPEKLCYPLLLVHGMGFRDDKKFGYWGRIPKALEEAGCRVFFGNQDSNADIETNGRHIAVRIDEILAETGAEKVNIIAHSRGSDQKPSLRGWLLRCPQIKDLGLWRFPFFKFYRIIFHASRLHPVGAAGVCCHKPGFEGITMQLVLLTALGVGGATVFGALIGFVLKDISHKFSDIVLSFAAGVMLAAAVLGLILPSLEYGGRFALLITVAGIFAGALCLNVIDKAVPHLHKLVGPDIEVHNNADLDRILLFVTAIAIHNLPEGIAAGVGFGSGDTTQALLIAGGIALQNIPEGIVIIAPMLSAGVSPKKTFLCAMATGLVEVVGTLFGYFAVSISTVILPFALAFAGGTMLYVISDEMIPETHAHGNERGATYALLAGFCILLACDVLLG